MNWYEHQVGYMLVTVCQLTGYVSYGMWVSPWGLMPARMLGDVGRKRVECIATSVPNVPFLLLRGAVGAAVSGRRAVHG
jgi:hypothetical protein